MNAIVKTLTEEAKKLTPEERIELVDEILVGIEADPAIDRQWVEEAQRRYSAYLRGEQKAVELEEILAKYGRK